MGHYSRQRGRREQRKKKQRQRYIQEPQVKELVVVRTYKTRRVRTSYPELAKELFGTSIYFVYREQNEISDS